MKWPFKMATVGKIHTESQSFWFKANAALPSLFNKQPQTSLAAVIVQNQK